MKRIIRSSTPSNDATHKNDKRSSHYSTVKAGFYDVPERPLDPPEPDDSWYDISNQEIVEIFVDAIINVNGNYYEYEGDCKWAEPESGLLNGYWCTDDIYMVSLGSKEDIIQAVDDLINHKVPDEDGRYRVTGKATLVYDVEGIESKRDYFIDEDGDFVYNEEAYSTENAEVELNQESSKIENLKIVKI